MEDTDSSPVGSASEKVALYKCLIAVPKN